MATVLITPRVLVAPAPRPSMRPDAQGVSVGVFRLATDPLFFADLTLRNVIGGSRYRITRTDTGAELATGVVGGTGLTSITISGVACYANPQTVTITVRKGTSAPKYLPYEAQTEISRSGGLAFIAQVADPIA